MGDFNPTKWAAAALGALMDESVLIDKVDRTYDERARNAAKVAIPVLGALVTQDGKSTETVLNADTSVSIEMPIDQESFVGIDVNNIDEMQNDFSRLQAFSSEMVRAIKNEAMSLNLTRYMSQNCATANKLQFTGVVSGATTLTFAVLKAIKTAFNKAKIPRKDRYLILSADYEAALEDVVDDEGNKVVYNKMYTGENSFDKGEVKMALGFEIIPTESLPLLTTSGTITDTASDTQPCIIAFQKSAIAACMPDEPNFKKYDVIATRSTAGICSVPWGRKVIRENGIMCIRKNT